MNIRHSGINNKVENNLSSFVINNYAWGNYVNIAMSARYVNELKITFDEVSTVISTFVERPWMIGGNKNTTSIPNLSAV